MGFLDHSTNNIIIDAVLTDTGRRLLASNEGRFEISFFSLADDEVDYSIIEKFGRAVGKEKVVKNTPIFEAQTKENLALKNRLLTLPDPTIVRLPVLEVTTGLNDSGVLVVSTKTGTGNTATVNLEQTIVGETSVPNGVSDITFTVTVPDRFVTLTGLIPVSKDLTTSQRLAYYEVTSNGVNNVQGAKCSFTVVGRTGIDDTTWNIYSDQQDANKITTQISVVGDQSGIRKDISLTVTKT